ncbi:MAG: class III extradiol ring-cleavage dioxygenase [Steroidobacteraceae bacterium]
MTTRTLPTYFISHGGGPWPWMMDQMQGAYDRLEASLKQMPAQVGTTPKAVLVISGHWEERDFVVMSSPNPPMLYDYYGFPEHTYRIKYAAPGSPQIAERVRELIAAAGFSTHLDPQRGFDHGTFAPLAVMYPDADVPILQLSLKRGFDPQEHIAVGRALAPLRDEGVLIVGSGLSFHNLREFGPAARGSSNAFDQWLQETLVAASPAERISRLIQWTTAPAARKAHPREEHLLPLMVATGAAGQDKATPVYHEENFFGGITVSSFMFGGV